MFKMILATSIAMALSASSAFAAEGARFVYRYKPGVLTVAETALPSINDLSISVPRSNIDNGILNIEVDLVNYGIRDMTTPFSL